MLLVVVNQGIQQSIYGVLRTGEVFFSSLGQLLSSSGCIKGISRIVLAANNLKQKKVNINEHSAKIQIKKRKKKKKKE